MNGICAKCGEQKGVGSGSTTCGPALSQCQCARMAALEKQVQALSRQGEGRRPTMNGIINYNNTTINNYYQAPAPVPEEPVPFMRKPPITQIEKFEQKENEKGKGNGSRQRTRKQLKRKRKQRWREWRWIRWRFRRVSWALRKNIKIESTNKKHCHFDDLATKRKKEIWLKNLN